MLLIPCFRPILGVLIAGLNTSSASSQLGCYSGHRVSPSAQGRGSKETSPAEGSEQQEWGLSESHMVPRREQEQTVERSIFTPHSRITTPKPSPATTPRSTKLWACSHWCP